MLKKERFAVYSHLVGLIIAIVGAIFLILTSVRSEAHRFIAPLYSLAVILLFTSSTLYHFFKEGEDKFSFWRNLDHVAIFIMIAGSYTPLCYVYLTGAWRWGIISAQWFLVLLGLVLKPFVLDWSRWIETSIYLLMGMSYYDLTLAQKKISQENAQAFQWINNHIPPQSRFLIVTGETDIFQDWTQEWFPALTNQVSETTIQGREWLDGADFVERIRVLQDIQLCNRSLKPLSCIEELSQEFDLNYEFIYITRKTTDKPSRENPLQGELLPVR